MIFMEKDFIKIEKDFCHQNFYAILWRDKKNPKYAGILWANGQDSRFPMPFISLEKAREECKRLSKIHETEIIVWNIIK